MEGRYSRLMSADPPARQRRPLLVIMVLAVVAILGAGVYVAVRVLDSPDASRADEQAETEDEADPYPIPTRDAPTQAAPQDIAGPVLLIPGYGGTPETLNLLASILRNDGRDVTAVAMPGNATGDLREQAEALGLAATEAIARSGAPSVDVIGYSIGGVVARLWVAAYGGDELARRVVTLGSPHHGLPPFTDASGNCPVSCQQLAVDSALLEQLNAGDETPEGPAFVSIWTTVDETVVPPESAQLEGAINIPVQSVCADSVVSHGELITDPVIAGIVREEIMPTPPLEFSAADCARLTPA